MAAPTKGNTTNVNPTPGASFYQFTHNQNTGNDGMVIVQLTMANTVTPSTATYNGVAMTRLYTINRGGLSQRMAFYYLLNPPTGNNTLRVNFSGNQWNPISLHARSFTNSGGIGASLRSGGSSSPNTKTLTVSQDSLIITTGSNKVFTSHNTNRQVATGAISIDVGESAGSVSLTSVCTFGNITLDRTEILGLNTPPTDTSGGDFFLFFI